MTAPSPDLRAALAAVARRAPSARGGLAPPRRLTHGALAAESAALAAALAARGVAAGAHVGVWLENRCEFVSLVLGLWARGATAVLLDPQLDPVAARRVLAPLDPALLVREVALPPEGAPPGCPEVTVEELVAAGASLAASASSAASAPSAAGASPAATAAPPAPDAPALVFCSSGSTGDPKGVLLTHRSFAANLPATTALLGIDGSDCAGVFLPLSGRISQSIVFAHLVAGGAAALEPGFLVGDGLLLDRFRAAGVTGFSCVPTQLRILLGRRVLTGASLPRLRYVRIGAGPRRDADVAQLRAMYPALRVYATYGMTEVGEISVLRADREQRPASVGRPLPDLRIAIVDEAGAPVPPGESGEIVVRGPRLMAGYGGAPAAPVAQVATGDLGRLDPDGFLYLEGRRKDLIKIAGENVSGLDVERALQAVRGVREVTVVAVPDPLLGEAPYAFVVPEDDAPPTTEELSRAFGAAMPRPAVPRRIELVASLPRLPSGKVDRRALQGRLRPPR